MGMEIGKDVHTERKPDIGLQRALQSGCFGGAELNEIGDDCMRS